MSDITVSPVYPTMSYVTAMSAMKIVDVSVVTDLSDDDWHYLSNGQLWLPMDRSRQRRCIESLVYGGLDVLGMPRFPPPVEFVAAVIAKFVHPMNFQIACVVMQGCEFTEHIINGVSSPVSSSVLFSFVMRIYADDLVAINARDAQVKDALMVAKPK